MDEKFTYTVSDGKRTATGTVLVTVLPVPDPEPDPNQAPLAFDRMQFVHEGQPLPIVITGGGTDDTTAAPDLQCTLSSLATSGTVTAAGCSFTYQPPAGGFAQTTTFTYTVTDSGSPALTSAPATVTLTLIPAPIDPDGDTLPGDLDFDFDLDLADVQLLTQNLDLVNATLKDGDIDRDGQVTINDLRILESNLGQQTLPGDIDDDGTVGFSDFLILSANFGQTNTSARRGDLTQDREIGFADFLVLSANFGRQLDTPGPPPSDGHPVARNRVWDPLDVDVAFSSWR